MPFRFPFVLISFFSVIVRMSAEMPFDFETTPGKLPKKVVPVEYSIRVAPNIDKLTFTGSETVKVNVRAPVNQIVLNSLELEMSEAAIDGQSLPKSAIKIAKKEELLTLNLSTQLPAGEHTISLNFSGKINQQGQGLYYVRYQEQGSGVKKTMLGTQFEATDARRFFPCWDEPSFRARFQLTAVVPENWLAVSNMPVESERKIDPPSPNAGPAQTSGATGIGKEVRFQPTPSMSSYLNVFVTGELDAIETKA